ncbi:MAG: DUF99 family protein [Halobaculum sp.]
MKQGVRALGVAASDGESTATLAGVVVRADRVVDGACFETCTVGGTDATDSVRSIFDDLGRDDVQFLVCAGIAPAWFNVLDLHAIHDHVERPVLSVSFESSPGLADAIREQFAGAERDRRVAIYERQPPRHRVTVGDDDVWVRAVGCDAERAREVVRAFTPSGSGRPEPVRVARTMARAGRTFRAGILDDSE